MLDYLDKSSKTLSIVGMAKNAGKTVALNAILDEAYENDVTIGLTSIGRDGERQDIVISTEKPMIYIYAGSIIATPEMLFHASDARMEVLEVTDFNTSMGKIIIGRVIDDGYVEIAGPCSNADIDLTNKKMLSYGADLVIVDGAIDRKSTASPSITDSAILATGAVLSRDMNKAIEKTVYQVELFKLKSISDISIRAIAEKAVGGKKITIIDDNYDTKELELKTALSAGRIIGKELTETSRYIVIPGSLVGKTALDIVNTTKHKNITIIVRDATRIFIDYKDWLYIHKKSIKVNVIDEIKLIGVTINPTAPEGYYFEPKEYKEKLQIYLKDLPVIDVME